MLSNLPFPSNGFTLLILSLLLFFWCIYSAFVSPLAQIPNAHLSAPYISLWILYKRFTKQENRTVYEAHALYGPIVRLGPTEISVNSAEAVRVVYGGNFDKHVWWKAFRNYGVDPMLSMLTAEPHRTRRRVFSNIYSKTSIQHSADMTNISKELIFNRLLPLLERAASDGAGIDVLQLGGAIGMDFISAFIFGLDAGTDFLRQIEERKDWLDAYDRRNPYLP